jgi:hypothetical protein
VREGWQLQKFGGCDVILEYMGLCPIYCNAPTKMQKLTNSYEINIKRLGVLKRSTYIVEVENRWIDYPIT